jgi:hypothetical protein
MEKQLVGHRKGNEGKLDLPKKSNETSSIADFGRGNMQNVSDS